MLQEKNEAGAAGEQLVRDNPSTEAYPAMSGPLL